MELQTASVSQPSVGQLTDVLNDILAEFEDLYIIIDALDECIESNKVLPFLEKVLERKNDSLHLLLTSRSERDIEEVIGPLVTSQVVVGSSFIEDDIRSYIRGTLRHDRKLRRWSQNVRDEIEIVLANGAQGMYVSNRRCISILMLN
jgi:hypothetical protein